MYSKNDFKKGVRKVDELIRQVELAQSMVNTFVTEGKELSWELFFAAVAMVVEERCKSNGVDARDVFRNLADASEIVYERLGPY